MTGLFNVLTKLALPVIALVALSAAGRTNAAATGAAATGLVVFVAVVVALIAVERSERWAVKLGSGLDAGLVALASRLGRGRPATVSDRLLAFRHTTFSVVKDRWSVLTASLVGFKFSQFVLLALCLHVVNPAAGVGLVEVFAAYAFGRILSTVPVTPAGVGVVETGSIAALTAMGGKAVSCSAAVLLGGKAVSCSAAVFGEVVELLVATRVLEIHVAVGVDPFAVGLPAELVLEQHPAALPRPGVVGDRLQVPSVFGDGGSGAGECRDRRREVTIGRASVRFPSPRAARCGSKITERWVALGSPRPLPPSMPT